MRSLLRIAVGAGLVLASGCTDPASPDTRDLVGRWVSAEDVAPQGRHEYHLTFTTAGRFAHEGRSYGVYPTRRSDALSGFTRIEGRFRRDGDRLFFEPERLVWWDSFYGESSPVHVEQPYPWGGVLDDARYFIRDHKLTMHFTTYPADAPEPTSREYWRVP